jgi:dTDP-4-amino-4,6-dideoxygalactose transaminase
MNPIPFNRPFMTGRELTYIAEAHANGHLSANGPFTKRCEAWLEKLSQSRRAILVHSGTAALEMAAILADIRPGDEVIMPSFTFVSTANAFVLRGAVPVFVDVRPDTLNLDEQLIEAAITPRTRAIVPVHYGGVSCEMDTILKIASRHQLLVIEDAAQSILCRYRGRMSGSLGHMAAVSFHETKSVISGEGGALLVNDPAFLERAEWIRDKGTNRRAFLAGETDKYTWVDLGSSYGPADYTAAFLLAQLEEAEALLTRRRNIWKRYHEAFEDLEREGRVRRPIVPQECEHSAHLYYLLLAKGVSRPAFLTKLRDAGIHATFHYVPLHSSPAGQRFGRSAGDLKVTDDISARIVRLPMWPGLEEQLDRVIYKVRELQL